MRALLLVAVLSLLTAGCAGNHGNLTPPLISDDSPQLSAQSGAPDSERYNLWGNWSLFFDDTHTKVDAVPVRSGRFHLNATKFLEDYCSNCLQIYGIHKNGDGTVDMTVQVTHPFQDHPEYTGFDVKGIIMFNGTHTVPWWSKSIFPYGTIDDLHYFYVSWAEVGDPELLNQDGYTVRWSPWWDSGSDLPIFKYWEGKYTNGTPTANLNAYVNFYTDEERHMFRTNGSVQREYHLSLPPGPIVAGYAIEACWEPPTVTPVTDPLNDFPVSANQEEPYYFRFVVNNDQPVTEHILPAEDCLYTRYEWSQWYGHAPTRACDSWPVSDSYAIPNQNLGYLPCEQEPPTGVETSATATEYHIYDMYEGKSGNYRGVAVCYTFDIKFITYSIAYDVFDFTLDY
jgi:hypothetical protein